MEGGWSLTTPDRYQPLWEEYMNFALANGIDFLLPTRKILLKYCKFLSQKGNYLCTGKALDTRFNAVWQVFKDVKNLKTYKKSTGYQGLKKFLARQGTSDESKRALPDIGDCVKIAVDEAKKFINPDGSVKEIIQPHRLRNLAFYVTRMACGWRRSQAKGMFLHQSFPTHFNAGTGDNTGFMMRCYGGKNNQHSWSAPVDIVRWTYPWDPWRILTIW